MTDTQVSDPARGWLTGQNSDLGLDAPTAHFLKTPSKRQGLLDARGRKERHDSATTVPQLGNPCLTDHAQACTCIFPDVGHLLPPFPNSIPVLSQSHLFIICFLFVFLFFNLESRMVALGQDFRNHPVFSPGLTQ